MAVDKEVSALDNLDHDLLFARVCDLRHSHQVQSNLVQVGIMDGRLRSSGVGWQSRRLTLALLKCWLTMQGLAEPGGALV